MLVDSNSIVILSNSSCKSATDILSDSPFYGIVVRVLTRGAIAQLARAPALQAGGPGFESLLLHHMG